MSFDVYLVDKNGKPFAFEPDAPINGGIYKVGGDQETWLNVTYNYSRIFCRVMGDEGLRGIHGKTGRACAPVFKKAMGQLKEDVSDDYWEPTEGNARVALSGLLVFAEMFPDGVFQVC